jgi:hypothetical protein|tara:strand:- start:3837 stop:4043 length:207 start_codon:yes stop_codon:yes gene_type:complete
MGIVKPDPPPCETINVRGLYLRVPIQSHVAVQIIADQKKHVGLLVLTLNWSEESKNEKRSETGLEKVS